MSYPKMGNRLAFFEPIMVVAANDTKPLCAVDIGAANATHGEFVCVVPCVIRSAKFSVTKEAVVGTSTAPYVVLKHYPTPGAGGSATTVATITIPDATAVGKVVYKESLSQVCAVGDVIQISHVIGTGGSVAGQGNVDWYCEFDPEVAGNNTDMSASST
jgi:hypothetical protein